jgi:hypothetical protein
MIVLKASATQLELQAPYHPALPGRSRAIGGKWMGSAIGWAFPATQEPAVRALCKDIWAVDGSPEAFETTVDLQVTVDERLPDRRVFLAYERPIYLVGREIAASLANRKAARPGRGIKFLKGGPRCIEASSIWATVIPNGCVFVIRDVPAIAVDRFCAAIGDAGSVEVEGGDDFHAVQPGRSRYRECQRYRP